MFIIVILLLLSFSCVGCPQKQLLSPVRSSDLCSRFTRRFAKRGVLIFTCILSDFICAIYHISISFMYFNFYHISSVFAIFPLYLPYFLNIPYFLCIYNISCVFTIFLLYLPYFPCIYHISPVFTITPAFTIFPLYLPYFPCIYRISPAFTIFSLYLPYFPCIHHSSPVFTVFPLYLPYFPCIYHISSVFTIFSVKLSWFLPHIFSAKWFWKLGRGKKTWHTGCRSVADTVAVAAEELTLLLQKSWHTGCSWREYNWRGADGDGDTGCHQCEASKVTETNSNVKAARLQQEQLNKAQTLCVIGKQ